MKSSSLSIGDAAARFGLETHVLRHWESVGLLQPERDAAGRRRYADADLVRVGVILRSKAAGMSLEQIAVLLDELAPSRHVVLEGHIAELERRAAEIERAREMTLHALNCRSHDITTCPRFRTIVGGVLDGTSTWPGTGELSTGRRGAPPMTASTG
jgi:MerR family transcriptional regulator, copper efflux regulator